MDLEEVLKEIQDTDFVADVVDAVEVELVVARCYNERCECSLLRCR